MGWFTRILSSAATGFIAPPIKDCDFIGDAFKDVTPGIRGLSSSSGDSGRSMVRELEFGYTGGVDLKPGHIKKAQASPTKSVVVPIRKGGKVIMFRTIKASDAGKGDLFVRSVSLKQEGFVRGAIDSLSGEFDFTYAVMS